MNLTALAVPRKSFWGFPAFALGWTWFFWLIASLFGSSIWRIPAQFFFLLGGVGVPLGAIVMTRLISGVAGLRGLGRRIVDPKRIGGRWWAVRPSVKKCPGDNPYHPWQGVPAGGAGEDPHQTANYAMTGASLT